MRQVNSPSRFYRLTMRLLKYFLLGLAGFILVCALSLALEMPTIAYLLIRTFGEWIVKGAVLLVGMVAIAVITESIR